MLISLLKNKLILAAILLLFLGVSGFAAKNNFFSKKTLDSLKNSAQDGAANAKTDSDGDGLADWEESIQKTDPNNPDTDVDGYLDGEEMASGYDPLKPAPNDLLSARTKQENASAKILQNFVKKVADEKQKLAANGQPDAPVSLKGFEMLKIAEDAVANLSSALGSLPRTSLWDLNITQDKSKAAIKNYALSAIKTISGNFSAINNESPEPILKAAIEKNDFSKINLWISSYEKTERELKQLAVPSPLLSVHQDALALLAGLSGTLKNIKQFSNDPISQLNEIRKYAALTQNWSDLINQTSQEIQNKYQITFSAEELKK
ncbi:hypothetical protein A3J02_03675 [Candidatus Azambacteria bacterium RIFCSPLOWO2_02_FULL_46_11]|uniref:EF-hand domain-containing protein n=1 Tax=Candidatus Azambacteria bacterium RIFCSPLOWO2_02_FULL_46_11 TaxID=1797300 RepID=A0A1F5CJU1_9BACT|nr:MAG: hypothetical protein A3J02_03675 [Candidatus Azambacteria bacterium RIFCSPLOWO2_02_FULL_46_11]